MEGLRSSHNDLKGSMNIKGGGGVDESSIRFAAAAAASSILSIPAVARGWMVSGRKR